MLNDNGKSNVNLYCLYIHMVICGDIWRDLHFLLMENVCAEMFLPMAVLDSCAKHYLSCLRLELTPKKVKALTLSLSMAEST